MKTKKTCTIMNESKDTVVCSSAWIAETLRSRIRGLLRHGALARESGLLIAPSSGVHTFGMCFPIDVVTLDRKLRVLGVWENVPPGKVRGLGLRTRGVLELASGRARECSLAAGDQLVVTSLTSSQAS